MTISFILFKFKEDVDKYAVTVTIELEIAIIGIMAIAWILLITVYIATSVTLPIILKNIVYINSTIDKITDSKVIGIASEIKSHIMCEFILKSVLGFIFYHFYQI